MCCIYIIYTYIYIDMIITCIHMYLMSNISYTRHYIYHINIYFLTVIEFAILKTNSLKPIESSLFEVWPGCFCSNFSVSRPWNEQMVLYLVQWQGPYMQQQSSFRGLRWGHWTSSTGDQGIHHRWGCSQLLYRDYIPSLKQKRFFRPLWKSLEKEMNRTLKLETIHFFEANNVRFLGGFGDFFHNAIK